MEAVAVLGRVPDPTEFPGAPAIIERFGSLKRAFAAVQRITGADTWDAIARRRPEDLLVYLALGRFRKRPAFSRLPLTLQRDMKAFFGTYTRACAEADALLFQAGDAAAIDEACKRSSVGKLLPDDLYVHREALDSLEPQLRIYEGCGRAYLGEVEGANLIKIHRRTGKLSTFRGELHPGHLRPWPRSSFRLVPWRKGLSGLRSLRWPWRRGTVPFVSGPRPWRLVRFQARQWRIRLPRASAARPPSGQRATHRAEGFRT